MLTPDELEQAGELVAAVYTDIEAEMLDYLVRKMIEGDVAGQRSQTALLLLSQSAAPELHRILDERGGEIDRTVRKEVSDALRRSDEADLAYIKKGLGVELPKVTNRQIAATVAGVEAILGRHNLQMEDAAREAFVKASAEAVTMVNAGTMTTEQALHRAVRKLERDGISVVQYQNAQTGAATVANKVDVAVRRHVRTQIAQDGARLTELRMDEAGIDFVEVSSHTGARPSHQEWEGRVYSRKGTKTVGGTTYRDFYTACHWGDVADGIYGANCRHSHGPYIPGMPRTYGPDPRHPSGLSNDEVYELNQKQRAMERRIRETKRELRGCQIEYGETGSVQAQADAAMLQAKLRAQQARLREHIDAANAKGKADVLQRSPRREWAGDMPKIKVPTPKRYYVFPQTVDTMAESRGVPRLNREQINKLQRRSDRAFSDMSVDQLDALVKYTTGEHNLVNQFLYGRKVSEARKTKAEARIHNLDMAIGKYHQREDIVVFSGTDAAHYAGWTVGSTYPLDGYVSTSVRFKDAKEFYDREASRGNAPVMLEIRVPKGTPCIFIGENTAFPRYQGELLLSHGLQYKVLERTETKLVLEVVNV